MSGLWLRSWITVQMLWLCNLCLQKVKIGYNIYISYIMFKSSKKLITTFLIFGFLVSSIVGCVLAFQSSSIAMNHDSQSNVAACCNGNYMLGSLDHNTPFILDNSGLQFLLLVFVSVYLFIKNNDQTREYNFKNYFKTRDRYGGFKLFYYFITLFRKGILHPKTY